MNYTSEARLYVGTLKAISNLDELEVFQSEQEVLPWYPDLPEGHELKIASKALITAFVGFKKLHIEHEETEKTLKKLAEEYVIKFGDFPFLMDEQLKEDRENTRHTQEAIKKGEALEGPLSQSETNYRYCTDVFWKKATTVDEQLLQFV